MTVGRVTPVRAVIESRRQRTARPTLCAVYRIGETANGFAARLVVESLNRIRITNLQL
jgi:hypothetical protein